MTEEVRREAQNFLDNETEFHLGFLPTEQSNPLTRHLDAEFARSTAAGVRNLQRADREVLKMARRVFSSAEFKRMVETGCRVVENGGRIVFSGCGATGRLSILLESMWREYFAGKDVDQRYADSVCSIMTGGDYALIRSVEFFEDYQSFGRRQVDELNLGSGDMIVAITEGGETSSVIGTLKEAVDRGMAAFLMFNNPAELLCERLVRCREVITHPAVTVLDLCCGPMAIAGSTRMQATTSEQLVGGALLEMILARLVTGEEPIDFAAEFERVLDHLESEKFVGMIADWIDFEEKTYRGRGKITYFAGDFLLDIFTDTTERSPTFMLPPFRRNDDRKSPASWAFVKDPRNDTAGTWARMLHRAPRCLEWTRDDYLAMGSGERIASNPPRIGIEALYKMEVGNEPSPDRCASDNDAAVAVMVADAPGNVAFLAAYESASAPFPVHRRIEISSGAAKTPLALMDHMAVKLVLNTVSTGTMVKMGRVAGNWMSWVDISNKKLIDRAIRLISELGALDYRDACFALYDAVDDMNREDWTNREKPSPVQYTLARVGRKS